MASPSSSPVPDAPRRAQAQGTVAGDDTVLVGLAVEAARDVVRGVLAGR